MPRITRYRGDTKPVVFQFWLDKDAGTPLVTTDMTFTLTVDSQKAPVDATTNVCTVVGTDLGSGRISFAFTEEQADIDPGTYFYDIECVDGDSYIETLVLDKMLVLQDITK